jgi:hypothetical protein
MRKAGIYFAPTDMASNIRLIIAILSCSTIVAAQQINPPKSSDAPERAPQGSTVTGRVYLDDTKAPCRKANVQLQPVALLLADAPPNRSGDQAGPVTTAKDAQFDGSYMFIHVAPGSYYVIANCPGYISPLLALSLAEGRPSGEQEPLGPEQKAARNKMLESFSRVDVQSNQPTGTDLVLERGGAISGNITYDDGEPAAELEVTPLARMFRDGKETWSRIDVGSGPFAAPTRTDDRGNYRISGLPSGKYALEVDLSFSMSSTLYISAAGSSSFSSNAHASRLAIYSGNTPRVKDAAGFTVRPREERTGEDIVIPISKLHTIRGNIVSAHDGHVVNSGQVTLLNADDQSYAGSDSLTEDNTNFTLSFVFEGDYVLSVLASADVDYVPIPRVSGTLGPPQFRPHVLHFYGSTSTPLHVDGDVDGLTIGVREPTAKEAEMYKNALQQEEQQDQTTGP